jgi:ribosomal protein S27E
MVVGQIVNNKIEFYASSYNEQVISALLTAFSIDLKKRIVNSRTVMDESEIYDVYCENCGGVLPVFPKPGEIVKCKWCQLKI